MKDKLLSTPFLLLYDGECGVCQFSVQYILKRDHSKLFSFAPLQGKTASLILNQEGQTCDLNSVILVHSALSEQQKLWQKSDAFIEVFLHLSQKHQSIAHIINIIPKILRDTSYRLVARNRILLSRIFALKSSCLLLSVEEQERFID